MGRKPSTATWLGAAGLVVLVAAGAWFHIWPTRALTDIPVALTKLTLSSPPPKA